jgi:serine/threonine protein kinase
MGTVYDVEDAVGEHVALKLFTGGAKNRDFLEKRFRAEAKLLATLEHPHLVKVRDTGVDESTGDPWFTMDLVLNAVGEPETLEDARRRGDISNEQLLGWYRDLSEELAYLHAHGIVHRDVKLENVLVDGGGHAVLSDFGISRIFDDKLRSRLDVTTTFIEGQTTGTRPVMGTYFYLAPEVRAGRPVAPSADWYALGVLFFRFLTGMWYEPPAASTEVGGKRATSPFDLLLAFDPFWQTNLPRLLSDDPAIRTVAETERAKGRRKRKWWLVGGVITVVILMVVSWAFLGSRFMGCRHPGGTRSLGSVTLPQPPPGVLWVSHPRETYAMNPSGVTSVVVKSASKRVWSDQFKRWPDIQHVTVEDGVESVDAAAFFGCQKLESVTLPDSLKHVDSYAFGDCFALREARFGKGLLDVGQAAFGGCSNLLHVYFGGDAPIARGTRIYVRTPTNLVNHVAPAAKGWTDRWPPNDACSRPVLPMP